MSAAAQSALTAATGDNTALATSIAMYSPSNSTLTCLATAQIQYSGQNAIAQAAALESYYTVMNQTVIGAGASGSAKVHICCLLHMPSGASALKGISLRGHLPSGTSVFSGICLHRGICLQGHLPSVASAFIGASAYLLDQVRFITLA